MQKNTLGLGLAWFAYLIAGYTPRNVYHFLPTDALFVKVRQQTKRHTGRAADTHICIHAHVHTHTHPPSSLVCCDVV